VIAAVDYNHYHVLFCNNEVKECYSNSLRVEAATALLPLDSPPLHQIGDQPEEAPDPDQPEGSDEENMEHLEEPIVVVEECNALRRWPASLCYWSISSLSSRILTKRWRVMKGEDCEVDD
jgi:hypothetical protein